QRAESMEIGRKLFEKEAARFQLSMKKLLSDSNGDLKRISNEYGYGRTDDLLAAIGYGKIVPRNVIAKYLGPEKFEALDKQKESRLRTGVRAVKRLITGDDAIVVRGVEDLMVNRARCCNPLHGEQIIGYITRGKGVAVHTARCKNVKQLMVNPERIVTVEWASKPEKTAYAVKLLAVTENRTGMIAGITGAISDMKTGIRELVGIAFDLLSYLRGVSDDNDCCFVRRDVLLCDGLNIGRADRVHLIAIGAQIVIRQIEHLDVHELIDQSVLRLDANGEDAA